jgi:tetratricopeptide (TPR) repeat protein
MKHRSFGRTIGAAVLAFGMAGASGPAFAQYAVMVFGGGYARDCYEAVKGKRLPAAKALEVCDIALAQEELSPANRTATLINRGILHMREQRYDRAGRDYEAAVAIIPMPEARINLGAMLYYLGRFPEAVAALDEGVKVEDPEARAAAYYNRALAYERMGKIEKAYADYNQALAIRPGYEPAARQLQRYSIVPASTS